jgi:DNA-directed RNA polymerase subunit RPC12/RpoP
MSKVIGMDGKTPPGAQINIKASDLKDIVCENCESKYFRQVQAFKRLSALISPSGKEQIVPIPIYRCDECGHINEEFLPKDA